jgi:hypothetical protein
VPGGYEVGMRGDVGCILCQKRLRLSRKVDECKPLFPGGVGTGPGHRVLSTAALAAGYGALALAAGAYIRSHFRST